MCILLTIVTCGIYGLYWFVCITDDTNEMSGENELAGGGMALLLTLVTCGIYGWYWAYKMGEKVDIIKNRGGMPSSNSGILFVVHLKHLFNCHLLKGLCRYNRDVQRPNKDK